MIESQASLFDRAFAALQLILPTHLLSRGMHRVARVRAKWFKSFLISNFMRLYKVDLSEAQITNPARFDSFNEFFTRALQPGARPLPEQKSALVSPVDGTLGQFGTIKRGRLLQAKGQSYTVTELLGGREDLAAAFLGGEYATLYLAPYNYHRVHMPMAGVLSESSYVPGRLFGVNPMSVRAIARLFTRNERVCALFDTPAGPMALVLVGAFFVGSIATTWAGEITPPHRRHAVNESFPASGAARLAFERGDEMGRFNLGSTVILLAGPGAIRWLEKKQPGDSLRLGQTLGHIQPGS